MKSPLIIGHFPPPVRSSVASLTEGLKPGRPGLCWQTPEHALKLALDTTMLWNRYCACVLSVGWHGRAIPMLADRDFPYTELLG